MIFAARRGGPAHLFLAALARSTLASYSGVFFSPSLLMGALFLGATFIAPAKGAAGLACLLVANLTAHLLGFERARIVSGEFGLNGLLVGLSLSAIYAFNLRFLALLILAGVLTAVLARAIAGFVGPLMGLPAMSLPFVLATFILYLAARSFYGLAVASWTLPFISENVLAGPGPFFRTYLQSLGAVFLQSGILAGAIVFAALLAASRIAVVLSLFGYTAGVLFYRFLGAGTADITYELIGFNFILTAIALGGIFVVPSLRSYLWATGAAALCAALGLGFKAFLMPYNLPVLALPFNFTVLLFLYCLKYRQRGAGIELVDFTPGTPEQNLAFARTRMRRQASGEAPPWLPPFQGEWTVWQGVSGKHTHQGPGRYAWDFVVQGDDGRTFRDTGAAPADYHAYGLPVVAPAAGLVIRSVSGQPDVPVGGLDAVQPWGNHVVIQHGPGSYTTLAHLKAGNVFVAEGQPVVAGQGIGLVGSSGRSPQPHLHFQAQRGPEPGGLTVPAAMGPILVGLSDAHWELRRRHVPVEGETVAALLPPADRFGFALRVGDALAFDVEQNENRWVETWAVGADLAGNTYLEEDRFGARALFKFEDGVFLMLDYLGARRTALRAFFLGATMISLDDRDGVVWRDVTPAKHLLPGLAGVLQFVTSPALAVWTLETAFEFGRERHWNVGGLPVEVRTVESTIRRGGPWSGKATGETLRRTRVVLNAVIGPLAVESEGRHWRLRAVRRCPS